MGARDGSRPKRSHQESAASVSVPSRNPSPGYRPRGSGAGAPHAAVARGKGRRPTRPKVGDWCARHAGRELDSRATCRHASGQPHLDPDSARTLFAGLANGGAVPVRAEARAAVAGTPGAGGGCVSCCSVSTHVAPWSEADEPLRAATGRAARGRAPRSGESSGRLTLLRPSQALVPEPKPTRGRLAAANAFPAQLLSTSTSGISASSRARFGARESARDAGAAIARKEAEGGCSGCGAPEAVPRVPAAVAREQQASAEGQSTTHRARGTASAAARAGDLAPGARRAPAAPRWRQPGHAWPAGCHRAATSGDGAGRSSARD